MAQYLDTQQTTAVRGVPQYGGDCALQPDGLSSSLKRLAEVTQMAVTLSYQIRDSFGLSVPESANKDAEPIDGPKAFVDRAVSGVRNANSNMELILEHLRS